MTPTYQTVTNGGCQVNPGGWPDQHTRVFTLLGNPVGHSLSPTMHNACFRRMGWNCVYVAFSPPETLLGNAVRGLAALGFGGANVTVPYKELVMEFLDEVAPDARAVGAVNTIENRQGRLIGHNTDVGGLLRSLQGDLDFDPAGQTVLTLGAGGAARAAVAALSRSGATRIVIANRSPQRARDLIADLGDFAAGTQLKAVSLDELETAPWLGETHLLINATPTGMYPRVASAPAVPWEALNPECRVLDMVPNPLTTRLVELARGAGHRAVGGLGMLVHQAALAWEIWFGITAPIDTMSVAAREVLASPGKG